MSGAITLLVIILCLLFIAYSIAVSLREGSERHRAFNEGRLAQRAGATISSNPYRAGDQRLRYFWARGYLHECESRSEGDE